MASSSSSFGASQSNSKYDVFLSFRGEDTRRTFTSHLYAALCRKNIQTFIDDEEIKRGDQLSPTLLSAIESSKISVTIFSQNYASSAWCLDELEKIIECKEKKQLVVLPVFYQIEATHVRHQRGTYEDAFVKHEERFRDNIIKVQKWRNALYEAANSAGWDSSHSNIRSEADLVEKIVEDILDKLKRMSPHVPEKGLVGITRHIAQVESLLCIGSADVRIIGIWGMGGIGKTTIADALCAKLSSHYEGCYFAANVREEWKNHRENELRNKLLAGILGDQNLCISTPTMSSTFVVRRLQCKKLLIVLDDVSDSKQLEYLVGQKHWYGTGSRIIVTTRNRDVFKKGVDGVYQVAVLNSHEALELFSLNAFQQDRPLSEYQHLSERAVDYAKGIPLALKILGSHLYSKRPKEWESALEKLNKIPKAEIYDVLRLSYEGLDPEEQNIFLDIACCLKGKTKSSITNILDGCGLSTEIGLRGLQDKSLVTVSQGNEVQMHDLIQEMGWQIVREESMKKPGKRSRLWDPKEIYDVLKYSTGTDSIESIALDTSQIKEVALRPQTFDKMYKLRLLNIYMPSHNKRRSNVHISRGLECLPDELSYLRWDCFPLKSLPPSFRAENLVELDLKHGLIEKLWDGVQDLVKLKSLYLSGCKNLIELPDLSLASKLEEVHLDDCTSLLNVPSSILSLDSLFVLNLRACEQLRYIQSEKQSRSLRWLNLRGCSRLVKYSVFSEKLEYLNLDGTTIEELLSSVIGSHCTIELLDCPKVENLPPIFDTSMSITALRLDNCSNLSKLPDNIGLLSKLNKLSLRGSNIENLPGSIKYLSQLRALNVSNCRRLSSLPELPSLLQDLNASNCISLETVSNSGITMLQDSFGGLKKRSLLRKIQEEEKMSIRHGDYLGRFEFYNCLKLDQTAYKTVMEEALIRILLAAYLSSMIEECYDHCCLTDDVSENFDPEDFVYISRPVYIILPGNEVLDWFMHRRTDSSTITLKLSQWWFDKFLGIAFCLVLGPLLSNMKKIHRTSFKAGCRYYYGSKYVGTSIIKSSCNGAESDQVWLCVEFDHCLLRLTAQNLPPIFDISMSIRALCLDNCSNLSKLPDNIGLLSKLNKLSLRGSNIENLPGSIKYLSQLRALNVSNCRRLSSLPELPSLLQDLNASNCISLETVSNSGITMLQDSFGGLKKRSLLRKIQEEEKMFIRHGDYLGRFEFYNCLKLDQTAYETVMEEALIRILLAAYLSSKIEECYDHCCLTDDVSENFDPENFVYISRPVYIILPGNEVPDWFMHRRTDSSTITLKLSQWWFDKFLGFAFCLVLGPLLSNMKKIHRTSFKVGCRYYYRSKYVGTSIIKSSCNGAESDHVWLWYDQFPKVGDGKIHVPSEISFEFFVWPNSSRLVVKQCGVRSLFDRWR